jgi:hypothetical protein
MRFSLVAHVALSVASARALAKERAAPYSTRGAPKIARSWQVSWSPIGHV